MSNVSNGQISQTFFKILWLFLTYIKFSFPLTFPWHGTTLKYQVPIIADNSKSIISQIELPYTGIRGGSRILRGGCQHTTLQTFPKNRMQSRKIWSVRGRPLVLLDPLLNILTVRTYIALLFLSNDPWHWMTPGTEWPLALNDPWHWISLRNVMIQQILDDIFSHVKDNIIYIVCLFSITCDDW